MNIMNRLSLRSMRKNKTTTLVTILGIIMSIALTTGLFIFANSLLSFLKDDQIIRNGDSHIILYDISREDADDLPNKELIEKTTLAPLLGVVPGDESTYPYFSAVGYNEAYKESLPFKLEQGRLPEKPGEILMANHVSAHKLGDDVSLELKELNVYDFSEEIQFGETTQKVTGKIVGISENSPLQYPHTMPTYFVYQSDEEISNAPRVWAGVVIDDLDGERLKQVETGFLNKGLRFWNTNLPQYYPSVPSKLRQFGYSFAVVLAVLVGIAGVALIQNGFMISLSQRVRELSVLSSVGMTRSQKWQLVLTESLSMFILGFPLGILFGALAMSILFKVLTPLLQNLMETTAVISLSWEPKTILLITVFSLLTLLASSMVPAFRMRGKTPMAGIRQQDSINLNERELRSPGIIQKLFGFEGDLGWKNMKRNRRRTRATMASLVFSLVLYLAFASILHFADQSKAVAETRGRDDLLITSSGIESYRDRASFEALVAKDGIERYSLSYVLRATTPVDTKDLGDHEFIYPEMTEATVELLSFDQKTLDELYSSWKMTPEDFTGNRGVLINQFRSSGENGNYLQTAFYKNPPESMDIISYEDSSVIATMAIEKVIDTPLENYDSWNPSPKIVVSQETLESLGDSTNVNMRLSIIAENRDYSELSDSISEDIMSGGLGYEVTDFKGMYQRERDVLLVARILFFGFATIIGLISLANIYNSLRSSLRFRRKEFAMLRSVGMDESSFKKMIRFESYFYAGKLLLFGLPLGVGVSYLIYTYIGRTVEFTFSIPVVHFLAAALVVVLILLLIMNVSSKSARRGTILDTLKLDMDV